MAILNSLFSIDYGQHEYNAKNYLESGKTPLISSKGTDNGCYGFFNIPAKYLDNIITVPRTGSIGHSFVQTIPCCVDDNCLVLIPKDKYSLEYLYYISTEIRKNRWRYAYGRQITPSRIGKIEVLNPTEFKPKISFINLKNKVIPRLLSKRVNVKIKRLKTFQITELCILKREYAPYLNQIDKSIEKVPYVTTTEWDNGISLYCNEKPNFNKGSITISLDGSCGITFYQFDDFISGEKTAVLNLKDIKDNYLLMYIANLIRIKSWRYHYGRKLSMGRLEKFELILPITDAGTIDLETIRKIVKNTYGSELFDKYAIK